MLLLVYHECNDRIKRIMFGDRAIKNNTTIVDISHDCFTEIMSYMPKEHYYETLSTLSVTCCHFRLMIQNVCWFKHNVVYHSFLLPFLHEYTSWITSVRATNDHDFMQVLPKLHNLESLTIVCEKQFVPVETLSKLCNLKRLEVRCRNDSLGFIFHLPPNLRSLSLFKLGTDHLYLYSFYINVLDWLKELELVGCVLVREMKKRRSVNRDFIDCYIDFIDCYIDPLVY